MQSDKTRNEVSSSMTLMSKRCDVMVARTDDDDDDDVVSLNVHLIGG